jgi:4-diphosphocytidyl-2-C-methyl-D-erythritol kinase
MNSRLMRLDRGGLRILAPAKLNLGLRVFPVRGDGFHDIESWFVPVAWHDTLTVWAAEDLRFEVTGRTEGIPTEHAKNLVTRAAIMLAERAGIAGGEANARIHLHKVLPPGGGLGGGSSDAASALIALNELWQAGVTDEVLQELAAKLGSDVPFFMGAKPSLCTGRGEIVQPLPPTRKMFAVLLIPPRGCPTKEVFQAFDAMAAGKRVEKIDWERLARLPVEQLQREMVNDLAAAAYQIAPWLGDLRKQAEGAIDRAVHLTGSGSTLFVLASSAAEASRLERRLREVVADEVAVVPTEILA